MNAFTPLGGQGGAALDVRGADMRVEIEVWRAMRLGATLIASKHW